MFNTMSILEFSKLSGVESSKLRYWESLGIFPPIKRDPENNYRHYSIAQLPSLQFVTTLSELEIPLKNIAEIKDGRSPGLMLEILEEYEQKLTDDMYKLWLRHSIVQTRRELMKQGLSVPSDSIAVATFPETRLMQWPRNEYKQGHTFLDQLAGHLSKVDDYGINLSYPIAAFHDDLESFSSQPGLPNHFLSVDPNGILRRKPGEYLTGYALGYYGNVGDLPKRMISYAEEHGLNLVGPVYSIYLHDEFCTRESSDYLVQCSIQIAKSKLKARKAKRETEPQLSLW
ncbi:MAG: MerR family transcriptional regulator [Oscillospiraceae bacterium]|nr:MerR family transcriptional regulator [Oscillospiraceae bacterium]